MSLNPAELVQRSPEWIQWRNQRIGSSDAPNIMGLGYKTPLELYEEKKGIRPPQELTYPMQRGTELEPYALEWYMENEGIPMSPTVKVHPEYDYLHASLDGLSLSGTIGLEIKCPMNYLDKVEEIVNKGVPLIYYAQIQHQIMVANLHAVDLLIFDGKKDGRVFCVERDQEFIDKLLEKELEFYKCLMTDTPPAEAPGRALHEVSNNEELIALVEPLKESNRRLKLEQELNDSLKDRLKELCAGCNTETPNGMKVTFIRQKGNVDYGKIPELKSVDLDKYRKADIIKTKIDFS